MGRYAELVCFLHHEWAIPGACAGNSLLRVNFNCAAYFLTSGSMERRSSGGQSRTSSCNSATKGYSGGLSTQLWASATPSQQRAELDLQRQCSQVLRLSHGDSSGVYWRFQCIERLQNAWNSPKNAAQLLCRQRSWNIGRSIASQLAGHAHKCTCSVGSYYSFQHAGAM